MKLRTQRMSGLPVDPSAAKLFDDEFKLGYDAAMAKHAKSRNEDSTINFMSVDMLAVKADLAVLEDALQLKYAVKGEAEMPKNLKQWRLLMDKYEAPIMLARSSEKPDEVVLVIVDTPIG